MQSHLHIFHGHFGATIVELNNCDRPYGLPRVNIYHLAFIEKKTAKLSSKEKCLHKIIMSYRVLNIRQKSHNLGEKIGKVNNRCELGIMTHACNPSYLGGRDKDMEDSSSV